MDDQRGGRDRRRSDRVKTLLNGRIRFNQGVTSIDCVIRNISPIGAWAVIDKTAVIPGAFQFDIPARGTSRRAKLRWREADNIGIEFLGESASDEPHHLHEMLTAENRRLKRAVWDLTARLEAMGQDVPRFF